MTENQEPRWVNAREAAAHYGVSLSTIWRALNDGRIRKHRIGARVLIDLNEADAKLKERAR